MWPWDHYLTPLGLSLLFCKMGIRPLASGRCWEDAIQLSMEKAGWSCWCSSKMALGTNYPEHVHWSWTSSPLIGHCQPTTQPVQASPPLPLPHSPKYQDHSYTRNLELQYCPFFRSRYFPCSERYQHLTPSGPCRTQVFWYILAYMQVTKLQCFKRVHLSKLLQVP